LKLLIINKKNLTLQCFILFGLVVGTIISGSMFRDNLDNSMYENDDTIDINLAENLRKGNSLTVNFVPTKFGQYSSDYIMKNIPNLPREEPSKGPTYYLFLALYYQIFDVEQKDLYLMGSIFNTLLSSIFIALYFIIIKKIFDIKIATISSTVILLLPYFGWMTASVSNESLLYIFFICSLYFFKKKTSHYFVFGIFAGLAHLTHPMGIIVPLSYFVYLILTKQFKGSLIVIFSWHLILLPWFIRNYLLFSDVGRGLQLPYSSKVTDMFGNFFGNYIPSSIGEVSPSLSTFYFPSPVSLVVRILDSDIQIMTLLLVFILLITPFAFLNFKKIKIKFLFFLPIIITGIYLSTYYLPFHFVSIIVIPSILILVLIFRTEIFQTKNYLSYFVLFSFLNFIMIYALSIIKPWTPGLRFVFLSIIILLPISIYSCYRLYNQFCPNIKKIYGQLTIPLIFMLLTIPIILNYDDQISGWVYDAEKVQKAQEMNNWIRQNIPQQTVIISNSEENAWLGTGLTSVSLSSASVTVDELQEFDKLIKYYNATHIVFYDTGLLRAYPNNFYQQIFANSIVSFPTPNFHFEKIYDDDSFVLEINPNTDKFWNTTIHYMMNNNEYDDALRGVQYYDIFMQHDSKLTETQKSKNNIDSLKFSNLEDLKEKIINHMIMSYEKQIDYKLNLILNLPKEENLEEGVQIYDDIIQLTNQKITIFKNYGISSVEKDLREKKFILINQQKQFLFNSIDQSIKNKNSEEEFQAYRLLLKIFSTNSIYGETYALTQREQNNILDKISILSMQVGKLYDAETTYLQIIGDDRFNPQAWKMYALILEQKDRYAQALHAFEMANTLNPSDNEIVEKIESLKEVLGK